MVWMSCAPSRTCRRSACCRKNSGSMDCLKASRSGNRWTGRWVSTTRVKISSAQRVHLGLSDHVTSPVPAFPPTRLLRGQPGRAFLASFEHEDETFAFFAHGTLEVTDKLAVTGGFRWTRDEKKANLVNDHPANNVGFLGLGFPPFNYNVFPCRWSTTTLRRRKTRSLPEPRVSSITGPTMS